MALLLTAAYNFIRMSIEMQINRTGDKFEKKKNKG